MSDRVRGSLAAIYLVLCVLLGGASAAGELGNALLQLIGVLLIVFGLWTASEALSKPQARGLAWIVGLFVLFVMLSLVPLPASTWEALPGREATARGFDLLGVQDPAIALSLARERSLASLLSLLPPIALFVLVVQLSTTWRRRLGWALLAVAVLSVALSAFQLLGGEGSPLRFYRITNPNRAVGFFANANHLPTLILCALPFCGVVAGKAMKSRSAQKRGGGVTIGIAVGLFLIAGIIFSGSMAGYALFLPAALATFLIYRRAVTGRLSRRWGTGLGALSLLFIAAAWLGPLNQQALSTKFSSHSTSRGTIWSTTTKAAADFFPAGSGLGTFSAVYRTFDQTEPVAREFVNHAHNDYLEVALDLGLPGLALVFAFIFWWARWSLWAWRDDFQGAGIARAGSVIIGIVLIHSIVDYPLRTAAIAAVFALGCAFMVPPPAQRSRRQAETETDQMRHLEVD